MVDGVDHLELLYFLLAIQGLSYQVLLVRALYKVHQNDDLVKGSVFLNQTLRCALYKETDHPSGRSREPCTRTQSQPLPEPTRSTIWIYSDGRFTSQDEVQGLVSFFGQLQFNTPLARQLLTQTVDAVNKGITGDDLRKHLSESLAPEAFALQEIMGTKKFYEHYRSLLKNCGIETPKTRSSCDMLIQRILIARYEADAADAAFRLFLDNRKTMKRTSVTVPDLYGTDGQQADQ